VSTKGWAVPSRDGTFTTTTGIAGFGKESPHDRLLGFDHDADSMRRKSAAGRGVAGIATGGFSLLASNNRGVLYVTVTGEKSGVQSFTTRNPDGHILTSARKLKAAADLVLASRKPAAAEDPSTDVVSQIQRLAELHTAGVLTDEEFAAKKSELLGRI
jgi:hypothetical protein